MKHGLVYIALLIIFAVLISAAMEMRDFGEPVNSAMDDHMIGNGQNETGANNIVTAVVFDYRGFDTLGEATVLFTAVSSVAMILRKARKVKKADGDTETATEDTPEDVTEEVSEEIPAEVAEEITEVPEGIPEEVPPADYDPSGDAVPDVAPIDDTTAEVIEEVKE